MVSHVRGISTGSAATLADRSILTPNRPTLSAVENGFCMPPRDPVPGYGWALGFLATLLCFAKTAPDLLGHLGDEVEHQRGELVGPFDHGNVAAAIKPFET